jgi:type IV secretory pathway VirB2 component (pilin)
LTGSETALRGKRGFWRGILPAVAVLCLVLLAMLVVAQVTHLHPDQSDADHCQLCIVMHTVVPVAASAAVIVIVQLGVSTPQADPIVAAHKRHLRLFIRPPPAIC